MPTLLDGKEMPYQWQTNVLVAIFKEKGDVRNCYSYRGVKLLEHAMKIVERGLERRIQELVNIDSMQFGFMPGRRTTDALFVVRRMQEKYRDKKKKLYCFVDIERRKKKKLCCFVDIERAFDRVPRKLMEWAMRKKDLPEVIVRVVMSPYHGKKRKFEWDVSYQKNSGYKWIYIKNLCCRHCFLHLQWMYSR